MGSNIARLPTPRVAPTENLDESLTGSVIVHSQPDEFVILSLQ